MALVWAKTDSPAWQDLAYGASTATWNGVAIGAAAADRIVVVHSYSTDRAVATCTIGGVGATLVVEDIAGGVRYLSMWRAAVPTGTTATIVITAAANFGVVGITVGAMTGAVATPTDTDVRAYAYGDSIPVTCTIPTGGIMLMNLGSPDIATTAMVDKGTLDYTTHDDAVGTLICGYYGTAGAQTVTFTPNAGNMINALGAAWEPASGVRKWFFGRIS